MRRRHLRGLLYPLKRIAKEPPFRLVARAFVWAFSRRVRVQSDWDVSPRPQYLAGVLRAAEQGIREGHPEICVIEFGVAHGAGLLALQDIAAAVEQETNIRISVYGFDTGQGLLETNGDFRDQPDRWKAGDFAMNPDYLRPRLARRTKLILGDVATTVPEFLASEQHAPIGFVAVDLDLYSSTRDALRIFTLSGKRMLLHVPMYFDDTTGLRSHRFNGELLAIDEFNRNNDMVKIDVWQGFADERAFPEHPWVKRMYVAHDVAGVSKVSLPLRPPLKLS